MTAAKVSKRLSTKRYLYDINSLRLIIYKDKVDQLMKLLKCILTHVQFNSYPARKELQ